MTSPLAGGVDCDLHPAVPHLTSLLPYLNDYWRDQVTTRGMTDLVSQSYPANSPISSRPDWRPAQGKPGSSLDDMKTQALDRFSVSIGICNPLYGVQMVFSEDMADAFCRALNDWLAREWLDKDARLRGSIVIPTQSVEKSVAEIERCAKDKRFVQVLMLVMGDMPLGKRAYWPIYAAAERLLSQPSDFGRLGFLPHRGLRRAGDRVPDPTDQPDRRGRVRPTSEPENGDAGIRLHLAAGLSVAAAQVLARRADGNAVGRPCAGRNCAQQHPLLAAAGRCAAGFGNPGSPV
jgi:Amidohydrolase